MIEAEYKTVQYHINTSSTVEVDKEMVLMQKNIEDKHNEDYIA
jgi:hypothetical protein